MQLKEDAVEPARDDIQNTVQNNDTPTQWLPTVGAAAEPAMSPASMESVKKNHKGLKVFLIVLAALVVIVVGAFFTANWYFSSHVAPGVQFRGLSLVGKTREQVRSVVAGEAESTHFVLKGSDGKTSSAGYSDMGVGIDTDKTVDRIMSAKADNMFSRVNPFLSSHIPFVGTVDDAKLQQYLVASLVSGEDKAVPASVSFDSKTGKYVATDGKIGKSPQLAAIASAIRSSFDKPLSSPDVSVDITDVKEPISLAAAQTAADEANARLANPIVIRNGHGGSYTLSTGDIKKWTILTPDLDKGTISVSYDEDAINASLPQTLVSALSHTRVDEQTVVLPTGAKMLKVAGAPQVKVSAADASKAVSQVISALESGKSLDMTLNAATEDYSSSVVADYSKSNGTPWMRVDLSKQQAYAYKGTTLVKTFDVATGSLTHQTPTGTFFVKAQLPLQTMVGDGYVTPDVRWISYFNGGVGFHAGYWDEGPGQQIEIGQPTSHGCINMRTPDAEWVYHFITIGSLVEVSGTTPSSPVRAPEATKLPTANGSQS
jgi:lipoprotein-anchoring transpeptidase ErfK/SrfK